MMHYKCEIQVLTALTSTAYYLNNYFSGHILTGVMMIGLAYFGNILPIAELLIFAILGFSGTATTGAVVGFADISPNFGGKLNTYIEDRNLTATL